MSLLETREGFAVTAGLAGITLIPLAVVWVLSFRSITRHSQAIRIANVGFRIALPLYILGVVLYTAYSSVVASGTATNRIERLLGIMADFFLASGVILFTTTIYLTGLAALYVALGRQKWWSWLRLDTLLGAGLLFILLIAYWAMKLSDTINGNTRSLYRWRMPWLLVVIDVTLALMSAGVVGIALYALPKLNRRKDQIPIGKLPVLLVVAAFLWAFTVTYGLAVSIKNISDDWQYEEIIAQLVISPLFGLWVTSAVATLLYFILHSPVWSDPAAIPADGTHAPYQPQPGYPQMAYQQPYQPGYAPQQYPPGYQQQPQQQYAQPYPQPQQQPYPPQGYQQPQQQQFAGGYPQPQQQQSLGGYQQPQQASPSPVTQTPTPSLPVYAHEVDANQNPHVTVVK